MRYVFTLLIVSCAMFSSSAEISLNIPGNKIVDKERVEIEFLLHKQVDAWNEGNLERFMETYWKSDKLIFVGSREPTYGWKATLENYKKGYPDKKAMGKLGFNVKFLVACHGVSASTSPLGEVNTALAVLGEVK